MDGIPQAKYLKNLNLDEKWMDAMALEYALLKDNSFIVSLFPSASNKLDDRVTKAIKSDQFCTSIEGLMVINESLAGTLGDDDLEVVTVNE